MTRTDRCAEASFTRKPFLLFRDLISSCSSSLCPSVACVIVTKTENAQRHLWLYSVVQHLPGLQGDRREIVYRKSTWSLREACLPGHDPGGEVGPLTFEGVT